MSQTVYSKGILHGLPTFPDHDNKKYSIIVTGANGISGSAMLKVLSENPTRWDKIYAFSRRPPQYPNNPHIIPIAVDFLSSTPSEIASVLKSHNIHTADYVYFASYIQPPPLPNSPLWSDTSAMTTQNVALLSNFLSALDLASITPKRTLLQIGGKYYGLHLGPTTSPMDESDPRHGIEPNFYFPQIDLLRSWTEANNSTYVITIPGFILGATATAAMNILYPLAVYASIQSHLASQHKSSAQSSPNHQTSTSTTSTRPPPPPFLLDFPSDLPSYLSEKHQSTATLLSHHAEWALLTPQTSNQLLNHSDGGSFAWGKFWPTLASWYNLSPGKPLVVNSPTTTTSSSSSFQTQTPTPPSTESESESQQPPPYTIISLPHPTSPLAQSLHLPPTPGIINIKFSFLNWSAQPHILQAWNHLSQIHHLSSSPSTSPFTDPTSTFGLLDAELLGGWSRVLSMNKNRKLGWNGFVDTAESIEEVIGEMVGLKLVPPMPNGSSGEKKQD